MKKLTLISSLLYTSKFEALLLLWFLAAKLHFFILNHLLLHIPEAQEQMSSDDEREEMELDLSSPDVVTKYKSAAEIINSQ